MISNSTPPIVENIKKEDDLVISKTKLGEEQNTAIDNSTPYFPKCDLCGEYFTNNINFKMHMAKVHTNPTVDSRLGHMFQCLYCNELFNTEMSRDVHMGIVHMTDLTNSKNMQPPSSTVSQAFVKIFPGRKPIKLRFFPQKLLNSIFLYLSGYCDPASINNHENIKYKFRFKFSTQVCSM